MMINRIPEILIISTEADIATDYVVHQLNQKNANFYRLNTEEFPLNSASSVRFSDRKKSISWEWHNTYNGCDFANIKSVWYRRHRLPEMPEEMKDAHAEYCLREADWFIKGCLWQLEKADQKIRWISPSSAMRFADSKILQLQIAKRLGFNIPETLVSTDPKKVRDFFVEQKEEVIAKPLRLGYFDYGEKQTSVYTSKVFWEDIQNDDEIKLAPVIYQKNLPKKYDIRVTIVGEKVFTVSIDSQKIPSAIIDWRKTETENIEHFHHQLPTDIEKRCVDYLKILGLNFGAIDFVLTPEDKYYFLEINPSGQWVWLEDKLKLPISYEIATWLSQGN